MSTPKGVSGATVKQLRMDPTVAFCMLDGMLIHRQGLLWTG